METNEFKELVILPALETIGTQLMKTAERTDKYSLTAAEYLRISSGYVMLAHKEMEGEDNA
tara:strand:- start:672 stop:854 length:183 start_codon:yes stop_codon:yes gene_type:complete